MTRLFELPVVAEMTRWSVDLLCGGISYDLSNGWQVWSKLLSLDRDPSLLHSSASALHIPFVSIRRSRIARVD